jgi:CubicO group peptidase (beta-lactamase class C family)
MTDVPTHSNPDLTVIVDNKANWNLPDHRRHGFHNLHCIARYGTSFRAARVMTLTKRIDLRIGEMDSVRQLTSRSEFSAMAVLRGSYILYERYAPDFGPDRPHSIQSINKMMLNLIIGRLVEEGRVELGRKVGEYLPWIGSGYAGATVQRVLNMDVANDYTEDYTDSRSTVFQHEEAMGWRLPADPAHEQSMQSFLAGITSTDTTNRSGKSMYKSANTDVLAMLAEKASGQPMRAFLANIADAAGLEGSLYTTTDREGFPTADGGTCLTARDLARFGAIFVRRGRGVDGRQTGSAGFIEGALKQGIPMPAPREWLRYSNQTNTDGRWLGHGGYGGQYMIADLTSGVVGVFFSVLEDKDGYDTNYYVPVIRMLSDIGRMSFK